MAGDPYKQLWHDDPFYVFRDTVTEWRVAVDLAKKQDKTFKGVTADWAHTLTYFDEPCDINGKPLNTKEAVKMKKDAIYVLDENLKPLATDRIVKSEDDGLVFLPIFEFKDEAEVVARIRQVGELRGHYYIVKVLKDLQPLPEVVEV